jgi:predicted kinase
MSTMRTMILTIGLPASGKSTWAKEQLKKEPKRWKRINKDDLRAMLDNSVWTPENEKVVTYLQEYAVKTAFNYGFDVIVDNTHLNRRAIKQMHALAEQQGNVNVIEKVFTTDLETCIARDPGEGKKKRVAEYFLVQVPHDEIRLASGGGLDDARWFKITDVGSLKLYDDLMPIMATAITILATK